MNWAQHSLVFALRGYQRVISPMLTGLFGPLARCRFEPSCSEYAVTAIRIHGAIKGVLLAGWRICRCQPWGGCGDDPVPPVGKFKLRDLMFRVDGKSGAHACGECHGAGGRG